MLTLKRVYEPAAPEDGLRVLVERRWPWKLDKVLRSIVGRRKSRPALSCTGGLAVGPLDGPSSGGGMRSNWDSNAKNWSACKLKPQNVQ